MTTMSRVGRDDVKSTRKCFCGSLMTVERTGVEEEYAVPYHVIGAEIPVRVIQKRVAFCNACENIEVL